MNIKKLLLTAVLLLSFAPLAKADKGMWILAELRKQNIERMKELGFTLPMDSLYSLDKPSVANAVVIFGRGCTGITVSNTGLIFTNHHCGYDAIQSQSTVDHDYLRDGFVSQSYEQELPIEGLTVKYLRKVENVTKEVVSKLGDVKDEIERIKKAQAIGAEIAKRYIKPHQDASVIPFYSNNEYFLIVYDVFSDVRMVFAPPSSVGKFGGDTDNWMWPRHTGDFSVFRVYADKNNQPADYSKDNVPYTPVYYAAVSLNGYKPGDYAMTIGYPGSTDRYLTSWGVENRMYNENEPRIEVRGIKQAIWKKDMLADQATRIKYASKYAQSANYWKNSIGMNKALVELKVIENKKAEQEAFEKWAQNKPQYKNVLSDLKNVYEKSGEAYKQLNYMYESLLGGTEIIRIARFGKQALEDQARKNQILSYMDEQIYKDYVPSLDKKVLGAMLTVLRKHLPENLLPEIYKFIDKAFKGDCDKYAEYVFASSVMPYKDKLAAAANLPEKELQKLINNDPAIDLANDVLNSALQIQSNYMQYEGDIQKGKRLYFAGRREMNPDLLYPSDANFTMRMSYGEVKGYSPRDGVWYEYYTTQRGVLEKEDPKSDEFAVQDDILNLLRAGNFKPYGCKKTMRTCFLSTNDITGGNSGSPVFDKNGRLIGLAFDGNWEAMSGDIEFDPDLQRTINVDIRYVLFMIDRWGKCDRLIKELNTIKDPVESHKDNVKMCAKTGKPCDGSCKKDAKKNCKKDCKKASKASKNCSRRCM